MAGGTEADSYNWRTGGAARDPGADDTFEDLAAACRATGAVPIFDLDVVTPANRTDPADQVAVLEAARRRGLPVDDVGIGNELFSNGPGFAQMFSDGAAYAWTVSINVRALHAAFAEVEVAADAIPLPEDQREQSWDRELGAGATGSGAPTALIVHVYPGPVEQPLVAADAPALFENVATSIAELAQAVAGLGKPVWLTEYDFRGPYRQFRTDGPPPAEGDDAHERYVAAFAAMLARVSGLELVDYGTAFADGVYGAWQDPSSPRLTPAGQALALVDAAARASVAAAAVAVPGGPTLPDGGPGVVGERFVRPGAATTAVPVNLTATPARLPPSDWLTVGARTEQVTAEPAEPETAALAPASGTVGSGGLALPPWSVTVVGSNDAAVEGFSASDPPLYGPPVRPASGRAAVAGVAGVRAGLRPVSEAL